MPASRSRPRVPGVASSVTGWPLRASRRGERLAERAGADEGQLAGAPARYSARRSRIARTTASTSGTTAFSSGGL